jgi:hypothetical protein
MLTPSRDVITKDLNPKFSINLHSNSADPYATKPQLTLLSQSSHPKYHTTCLLSPLPLHGIHHPHPFTLSHHYQAFHLPLNHSPLTMPKPSAHSSIIIAAIVLLFSSSVSYSFQYKVSKKFFTGPIVLPISPTIPPSNHCCNERSVIYSPHSQNRTTAWV